LAPLSIAVFHSERNTRDDLGVIKAIFDVLCKSKREVDPAGYLDHGLVAVLLPDTNAQGAQVFAQRITRQLDDLRWAASTATYPDHLFENLTQGSEAARNITTSLPPDSNPYLLKRSVDVIGSVVALLLFASLMLITALAIKLTSAGPVIFKQTRLGKGGVPFAFYKFRSMRCNVDDRIHREFVTRLIKGDHERLNQQDSTHPCYKMKSDPRITRVGKFIRVTSIDELPQLFCVLKGDMSLVGPRPPLPYEAREYQPGHCSRLLGVRPGITGLWQVKGRSKVSFDDMVRMDLRYIRDCSLQLDLRILLKTVGVVLNREGAG
jgi:lipopolysaccharide/colanic/teichoic acid biosynthesis glycosyltransferase